MVSRARRLLAGMALFVLSACGGGGGGGGSTPPALSFTPASIDVTTDAGTSAQVSVGARINVAASGTVYVFIVDADAVLQPTVSLVNNPDGTFTATVSTVSTLALGIHSGSFAVHLCKDSGCAGEYPGSPVGLPYKITMVSGINETPLSRWSGVADWETFQGNTAHTGYVPVTLDPTAFSRRWRWVPPDAGVTASAAVIANGLVYVTTSGYPAASSKLHALDEFDASEHWNHDFGSVFAVNPPAVSGGRVYLASSGQTDTAMWSFDAVTGVQSFRTPFSSQWEHYLAPTVANGAVYTDGGSYGGMLAFDATGGARTWSAPLNQYDQWTPAVDAQYAYAYVGDSCSGCANAGLSVFNLADGSLAFTIKDPAFSWSTWSIDGAPVIGPGNTVLAVNGVGYGTRLIDFDTANHGIRWSAAGTFATSPVLANGVAYVANKSPLRLEAYRAADGVLLWSWAPTDPTVTGFTGNLVATDNLVFVSTDKAVHAIDLNRRASVWSYGKAASAMALSAQGVLYLSTPIDGALQAINLK